jgi:hypothetical protein
VLQMGICSDHCRLLEVNQNCPTSSCKLIECHSTIPFPPFTYIPVPLLPHGKGSGTDQDLQLQDVMRKFLMRQKAEAQVWK